MVVKRAGECPAVEPTSEVTNANYGIYVFVRQVLNLSAISLSKLLHIKAFTDSSGKLSRKFLGKLGKGKRLLDREQRALPLEAF